MARAHRIRRLVAVLSVLAFVTVGCGGDDKDTTSSSTEKPSTGATTNASPRGEPVHGGSITIGLEAETNSWIPGTANFSNSGINVALAIYDPLFRLDESGAIRPYLAESLAFNDALTEWTVKLRPGVTFHDGTPLNAQAIKTDVDT